MGNEASVVVETVNSITDAILEDPKFIRNLAKLLKNFKEELLLQGVHQL